MDFYTDTQPFFQHRPLGSFSGPLVAPCSFEGSQISRLDSSNSPNARISFQPPMADARVVDQGASGGPCRFRCLLVDDCSRSRLFAMALDHFFLRRDPADSSPVYCIICLEYFADARKMLRHLRNCDEFYKGEYWCPTCNTKEHFRTSTRKKCSWLRTRLGNKIKKGLEEALKLLPGSKQTLCSKCGSEIDSVQPSSPPFEQKATPPVGELYDTSPLSELHDTDPKAPEIYPYAMGGPQAPSYSSSQGISEIDSHAVGFGAFPERAGQQTFPTSSNPPYASAKSSSLAPYDTSPIEVSSVAPTHTGHTAFSVSPTSSTDSSRGGLSRQVYSSPEPFSTNLDNFAADSLDGCIGLGHGQSVGSATMPAAFVSHPAVSMDSFQENLWNPAISDTRASRPLTIDTAFVNTHALSSTWGPQNSYMATPTMASFRYPLMRAGTNPSNINPTPNIAANENGSPMSAHPSSSSSSSTSTSSSQSPSPSSTTATASPTSDASGPASTDEAGAGGSLRCSECDYRPSGKNAASFRAYLRKHRLKHGPRIRVQCNHCDRTFTRRDNCLSHASKVHSRKRPGSSGVSPPDLQRKKTRGLEAGEP